MMQMAVVEERAQALRADAARNRERIVAAAAEVLAESGLDASTAEIAHRAGVGEATLFRRFPTKLDLVDAVLEQKMQASVELLASVAADPDPERAIERLFTEMIGSKMQSDLGFLEAAGDRCMNEPQFAPLRAESLDLMGVILKRAQEAGAVREDLQAQDMSFLLMAAMSPLRAPLSGLREDLWKRYTRIILDGMRPEGAHKLSPGAPPRKLIERRPD
jgi:AcrR family transcriptional regulator